MIEQPFVLQFLVYIFDQLNLTALKMGELFGNLEMMDLQKCHQQM